MLLQDLSLQEQKFKLNFSFLLGFNLAKSEKRMFFYLTCGCWLGAYSSTAYVENFDNPVTFLFSMCELMGFEENDFENKSNFHQSDEIVNKSFLVLATHASERW